MAIQEIDVGEVANDGQGNTLRVAFQTVNENFAQLDEIMATVGLYSLNGLTNATQTFAIDQLGTDFGISSSDTVHTLHLPLATAASTGKLSAADFATFNAKVGAAGNGLIKVGNFLHVAQSTDYIPGTIPIASGEAQLEMRTLDEDDIPNLNTSKITTGTWADARMPAFTGDVTTSAGSVATTIAAGVVTDAKIGNRTVDDTQTATGNTGTLTAILSWIANLIKGITGKSSWRTAPRTTLENSVKRDGDSMVGTYDIDGDINLTGSISVRDLEYIWPTSHPVGTARLTNDSTGILSWTLDSDKLNVAGGTMTGVLTVPNLVLNQSAITYASTITFDFDGPAYQTVSLTGNLILAGTHMGVGKSITIELLADSSDRTITYDAGWVIFGSSVTTVTANKRVLITLKCNSTTAASVRGIAAAQV